MKTSAVQWLEKVFNEHLKNPFSTEEWKIAFEFAKEIESEKIKESFVDGEISMCKSLTIN